VLREEHAFFVTSFRIFAYARIMAKNLVIQGGLREKVKVAVYVSIGYNIHQRNLLLKLCGKATMPLPFRPVAALRGQWLPCLSQDGDTPARGGAVWKN
jgi:hypothetical protein